MRYGSDDVHAVLMAAASIYGAQPKHSIGIAESVERATDLLNTTRKHLEQENLQAEVNSAYQKAQFHRINPEDIKSLDGSLLPDPRKGAYHLAESMHNLHASVEAAIEKAQRAEIRTKYPR